MRSGTCSPRRAWARRIDASASSRWPTATAKDCDGSRAKGFSTKSGRHDGKTLTDAAYLWPTPNASVVNDGEAIESWRARQKKNLAKHCNGNGMGTPLTIASLLWATPTSHERTHAPRQVDHGQQLANQASLWATPIARDARNDSTACKFEGSEPLGRQVLRTVSDGRVTSATAVLAPSFVEALMGLPPGWTEPIASDPSGTRWSRWLRLWRSELSRLVP